MKIWLPQPRPMRVESQDRPNIGSPPPDAPSVQKLNVRSGLLLPGGDVIADEGLVAHVEDDVRVRRAPEDLLEVRRGEVDVLDERVGPAVVQPVTASLDLEEQQVALVGVPGRDRGVVGLDDGVGAGRGHRGDAPDRGPELRI